MTKDFFYNVNGAEFHDTIAFGKAWKEAKALAIKEHCGITRTVVCGHKYTYEFYAKGAFLNERFYTPEKMYIF